MLVLVGVLVLVTTREPEALIWVGLLAVAALPAWIPPTTDCSRHSVGWQRCW